MKLAVRRLLTRACVAILFSSGVSARAADAAGPQPPLKVDGMVQHAQTLTIEQIRAMPAYHVEASFSTMHGQDHHTWTGAAVGHHH